MLQYVLASSLTLFKQRPIVREAREYYKEHGDVDLTLKKLPRHLVAERSIVSSKILLFKLALHLYKIQIASCNSRFFLQFDNLLLRSQIPPFIHKLTLLTNSLYCSWWQFALLVMYSYKACYLENLQVAILPTCQGKFVSVQANNVSISSTSLEVPTLVPNGNMNLWSVVLVWY